MEVTISLTILAAVLVSAFFLAGRALRLQQNAEFRTGAANLQQEQAEALRNFRDNKGWSAIRGLSEGTQFYMVPDSTGRGWEPRYTQKTDIAPFRLAITATRESDVRYRFSIATSWTPQGTAQLDNTTLTTYLTDTTGFTGSAP